MSLTEDLVDLIRNKPIGEDDLASAAMITLDALATAYAGSVTDTGKKLITWAQSGNLDGKRQAFFQRFSQAAHEREVGFRPGRVIGAKRIQYSLSGRGSFDDRVENAWRELRLAEDAGGLKLHDLVADLGDPQGARRPVGADRDRAHGIEIVVGLEIVVGVVEHDEGRVLDRRQVRPHLPVQRAKTADEGIAVLRVVCRMAREMRADISRLLAEV